MPSPTLATLIDRLQDVVKLPHNLLVDAADYGALLDAILTNSPTPRSAAANALAEDWLRAVSAVIFAGGQAAEAELQAFAEAVTSYPATNAQNALTILYRHFVDYPLRVRSRGIAFGTLTAAAGNVWNGVVQRQLVDEEGFELEAVTLERKVWECVSDARTGDAGQERGSAHREFFVVRGENVNLYGIDESGTGLGARVQVRSPLHNNHLSDPVFTAGTFATRPSAGSPQVASALSASWAAGVLASVQFSVDDLPRTYKGSPEVFKAIFKDQGSTADNSLTQTFSRWAAPTTDLFCYHAEVWLRRKSSADGTATIRLGSKTATVSVSGLSDDDWTRFRLSDGTDSKGWPRAWNTSSATFAIELSGNTTGELEVCYPMLTQMDFINGTPWALTPGEAEANVGDQVEVTDALDGSDSKIQQMLVRWYRRYLPHCGDATPITASGGRTFTFAAAGKTLTASSGSFVSDGYKAGMACVITGTSSNNGRKLIATVAATVLTFHSTETLVNEGPLSATAAIDGEPYIEDPS